MSDSLWPHGVQHARFPCPSPTPGACSNSCPSSWWCHPTISSSVVPFSCLQSFAASQSFPMCLTFLEYCLFLASVTVIQSISYSFISDSFVVSSPSLNENPFPLLMYSFLFKLVSVLGLYHLYVDDFHFSTLNLPLGFRLTLPPSYEAAPLGYHRLFKISMSAAVFFSVALISSFSLIRNQWLFPLS